MNLIFLKLIQQNLEKIFQKKVSCSISNINELMIDIESAHIIEICFVLKNNNLFKFEQLSDICGVDYLTYGIDEWNKLGEQIDNFSRGMDVSKTNYKIHENKRFAVIYNLLSLSNGCRIRLRSFVNTKYPITYSVHSLWPVSNWFEREVFDLYGVEFINHPDLRRILTDYSFEGFPCRKDFSVIGETEVIYDKKKKKVISQPVKIINNEFMPKTIREDSRYG